MTILVWIVLILCLAPVALVFILALLACVFGENEKERGERVYREYTNWKEERIGREKEHRTL